MMTDLVSRLIEYEDGEMTDDQIVELFVDLLNEGWVGKLQGRYGRMAEHLIREGFIAVDNRNKRCYATGKHKYEVTV